MIEIAILIQTIFFIEQQKYEYVFLFILLSTLMMYFRKSDIYLLYSIIIVHIVYLYFNNNTIDTFKARIRVRGKKPSIKVKKGKVIVKKPKLKVSVTPPKPNQVKKGMKKGMKQGKKGLKKGMKQGKKGLKKGMKKGKKGLKKGMKQGKKGLKKGIKLGKKGMKLGKKGLGMGGSGGGESDDNTKEDNLDNLDPGYSYTNEDEKLMSEKIPEKLEASK